MLGTPEIEEVVYQFVPDASTRLVSLISGELDIIERVEPEQYETLLEENVTTSRTVSTENKYLHFRCYEPPFDDVRLRHAAAHAIDRDLILELMGPAGHPTVGQLSSAKFGYTDTIPNSPEYNPERCQELLAEAGYPGGDGLPPIEYLTSQGFYPKTKEYGEVITALLQEQGLPGRVHGDGGRVLDRARVRPRRDRASACRYRLDDRIARAQPGAQAHVGIRTA